MFTGHGCFGEYLGRIQKETSGVCLHCDCPLDTAQHTLAECPAWEGARRELIATVGGNLSLPVVVQKMLGEEAAWKAVSSFCEIVMAQKEETERGREKSGRKRRGSPEPTGNDREIDAGAGPPLSAPAAANACAVGGDGGGPNSGIPASHMDAG